jgi:hypothetical protein
MLRLRCDKKATRKPEPGTVLCAFLWKVSNDCAIGRTPPITHPSVAHLLLPCREHLIVATDRTKYPVFRDFPAVSNEPESEFGRSAGNKSVSDAIFNQGGSFFLASFNDLPRCE